MALFMSSVTYQYYSPVRFVNESNTARALFLIAAAVRRLTFIILTCKGKHFSSSLREIRLPWCHVMQIFHPYHPCLVSWYQFYIEWKKWALREEKKNPWKEIQPVSLFIGCPLSFRGAWFTLHCSRYLSSRRPGSLIFAPVLSFISLFLSVLVALLSD